MKKYPLTLLFFALILFAFTGEELVAGDSTLVINPVAVPVDYEKLFFETIETSSSDDVIREHLRESFPVISEDDINKVLLTKTITIAAANVSDSLDSSSAETLYKVSFEVPKNFLADSTKISWELNIPGFESKLFQLYQGNKIYIDTWPNVVGTIKTKTYTGNFQAYKIRNWPFYKDPDPKKSHLEPTRPGEGNPLGLFVVHYDENSLRYFHGTNMNGLLGKKMRNLSHGCVRNDNSNIEKMKKFLIKKVVKSQDLTSWLNSKKTLIYEFQEQDKFPVIITYKTFDLDTDANGKYMILYKDVYNYSQQKNIDAKLNDINLITLTNKENLFAEYRKEFGNDIPDEALWLMIDYLLNNAEEYEKHYLEDLKQKFFIQN